MLDIQSNHAPAHYNMGQSLATLDRLEEAVVSFQSALNMAPARMRTDWPMSMPVWARRLRRCARRVPRDRFRPEVAEWNGRRALLGRYAEGWLKYEGRWFVRRPRADARLPDLAEVAGESILLTASRGMATYSSSPAMRLCWVVSVHVFSFRFTLSRKS